MLEPPDPRDHVPNCAALCDLPLLYVVSTGEYECDDGHSGHECTCDELARQKYEDDAFAAWERNNG